MSYTDLGIPLSCSLYRLSIGLDCVGHWVGSLPSKGGNIGVFSTVNIIFALRVEWDRSSVVPLDRSCIASRAHCIQHFVFVFVTKDMLWDRCELFSRIICRTSKECVTNNLQLWAASQCWHFSLDVQLYVPCRWKRKVRGDVNCFWSRYTNVSLFFCIKSFVEALIGRSVKSSFDDSFVICVILNVCTCLFRFPPVTLIMKNTTSMSILTDVVWTWIS